MHSKSLTALGLVVVLALLVSSCGPTPEPQVVEKEVIVTQIVEKIVTQEVEVIKEVEVVQEVEVVKEVEVTRIVAGTPVVEVVTATPEPAPPAAAREVVVLQQGEPATLDWHMHADLNAHEIDRQIFDTLLRRDRETLDIVGNLAESYEMLDDTTWQFKLREGVQFHNGEPFNADVVKYSVERFINPDTGAPARASLKLIDHVDVIDEYTVNIVTSEPFPLLPTWMCAAMSGTLAMVPPQYIEENGADYFATHPVGTGPFKFVEWVPDEYVKLEANEDYFGGAPSIKALTIRPVVEPATRLAAILTGEADLVAGITPDDVARIDDSGIATVEASPAGSWIVNIKLSNLTSESPRGKWLDGPWQDVDVRKALNYAVDMQTIIDSLLMGQGRIAGYPVVPSAPGYNPETGGDNWYPYDPDKARQLLADAGYADGFEMTLHVPNHRYPQDVEIAQAVASYLGEVGVETTVEVHEQSVYTVMWKQQELLPAYIVAWGGAGLLDPGLLINSSHTESGLSIFNDPELDALYEKAATTMDPLERAEAWEAAQEKVHEVVPFLKSWQPSTLFAVSNSLDWEPWLGNMLFFKTLDYDASLTE